MNYTKTILFSAVVGAGLLAFASCSKVQPPHVVAKCKAKFDICMAKNVLKGPFKAHEICMAERTSECR